MFVPGILIQIMRVAVVFDTPYSGWDHPDHERQMEFEVAAWKANQPEMEYQIAHVLRDRGHDVRLLGVRDDLEYLVRHLSYRLNEEITSAPDLSFPLIVKPLQADASAGIAQASVVQDVGALSDRVSSSHQRFGQGGIAEEFVVFDKRKSRPERIATQFAKWDESYRERKGIRNVLARPIANANPFISYGHDMANSAAKAGMEYSDFNQRIVDSAMARYEPA
jgi:hypothetical protein